MLLGSLLHPTSFARRDASTQHGPASSLVFRLGSTSCYLSTMADPADLIPSPAVQDVAWLRETNGDPWWRRLSMRFWTHFEAVFLRQVPWLQQITPPILRPDFTWRHRALGHVPLANQLLPRPAYARGLTLRLVGRVHDFLLLFSRYYCAWFHFPCSAAMASLPFGLVLKKSDGTSLDEVQAMRAVRAAGIPAPKVIAYGDHPDTPWAPISILMTRLPGEEMGEVYEYLEPEEQEAVEAELATILGAMRSWTNPYGENRICSISGGAIRSVRVPGHKMGPYAAEAEFTAHLLSTASSNSFDSAADFEKSLATARTMEALKHDMVFTHGDFYMHNILIHDGHISGLIDWETAGWYPDYWEFTTPLRWASQLHEWRHLLLRLSSNAYERELEAERAIRALTVDSWIW